MDEVPQPGPWLTGWPETAAIAAGFAACAIRAAQLDRPRPLREVLVDSIGTAALSFLAFEVAYGSGVNIHFAIGAAGVVGTLGWAATQRLLTAWVRQRLS